MQNYVLNFLHPSGQTYLPIEVNPAWGIYDIAQYVAQTGFIPEHTHGYFLAINNQSIDQNYACSALNLPSGTLIQIIPKTAQHKPQLLSPTFGHGGKATPLLQAIKQYQASQGISYASGQGAKETGTLFSWLSKLFN